MKERISLLLAAAALLLLPSCRFIRLSDELKERIEENGITWMGEKAGESFTASDMIATRSDIPGVYHALNCSLPCDIVYTPGDCGITLHGPDNVLDKITVINENGTLSIRLDARVQNLKNLQVELQSPVLERLTCNGAVNFKAPEGITALDFTTTVNGAGDIDIRGLKAASATITVNGAGDADIAGIDCEKLSVSINGAGDATLAGRTDLADLTISGAGDIDARQLACGHLNSKVRGVGSIRKPK